MGVVRSIFSPVRPADSELEQLFKEFYDRLVFFSFQILKNQQQAEDTAQDAFIAYWQQRDSVSSHPLAIKNFLYSSVRNASLNTIRHAKVVGAFEAKHNLIEPAEEYILESIISSEIIAELYAAINALPENLQLISRLSFLEGKKNHEVADELDMSVNTVKKQKRRSLELLRLKLRPETFLFLLCFLDK